MCVCRGVGGAYVCAEGWVGHTILCSVPVVTLEVWCRWWLDTHTHTPSISGPFVVMKHCVLGSDRCYCPGACIQMCRLTCGSWLPPPFVCVLKAHLYDGCQCVSVFPQTSNVLASDPYKDA